MTVYRPPVTMPARTIEEALAIQICRAAFKTCACEDAGRRVCVAPERSAEYIIGTMVADGWKRPKAKP